MKKLTLILIASLLLGGCVADKKTDPPTRSAPAPLPDNTPMLAAMHSEHQETLRLALKTNKDSALTVPISSVPPIPEGFRSPWERLTTLTIITGCSQAGGEQCLSPSMPAAGPKQRAKSATESNSPPMDGQADTNDRADVGNVIDERTDAAPSQPALRLIQPGK